MTKFFASALALALGASTAAAQAPAPVLQFQTARAAQDVFTVRAPGQGSILTSYMPFLEWKTKHTGAAFPMEVAPVLAGLVAGDVKLPPPRPVDASKYRDQAAEFAGVVNFKNKGGRVLPELRAGVPLQKLLAEEYAGTHVVQTVLSTVVPVPLARMGLNPDKFAAMVENIDLDHYHFQIPGSFAIEALEQGHIASKVINFNRAYLLSVIDLRDYGCNAMKDGVRDYFSRNGDKKKLMNESIYMVSDLDMNNAQDLAQAERYFGKRPDAVLSQNVLFADHLVKGAKTIFLFFAEGNSTRIVLVSNIAMRSKFFVGTMAMGVRPVIMDGVNNSLLGKGAKAKDSLGDLISGATADVNNKNACDRGLALGLTKYSQRLFSEFASYIQKN